MSDNHETLRDKVLATLPAEAHTAFLRLALDAGINNPDDAAWGDVALAYAASVAAAAASDTAKAVQEHAGRIPDAIYQGTIRAGADLRGQVAAAGQEVLKAATDQAAQTKEALVAAVQGAAQAGAGVLGKAVQGMDQAAREKIELLIARGIESVGAAVRADARASVAGRMARSWGVVASLLLFFLLLGVVLTWGGLYLSHHVTPLNMEIATNSQGQRLCGPLRGSAAEACLVRQQ